MKKTAFIKLVAALLAMTMLLGLTACGSSSSGSYVDYTKPTIGGDYGDDFGFEIGINDDFTVSDDTEEEDVTNTTGGTAVVQGNSLTNSDMRYVLIYNPNVYDENNSYDDSSLDVGSLGSQIDVFANRGDGLEEPAGQSEYISISQDEWLKYLPEDLKLEGDRAEVMGRDYTKGQTREFFVTPGTNLTTREAQTFTCQYAGKYCHIWTMDNSTSDSAIQAMGQEFDQQIYQHVTEMFGTPRFVGLTGKVNLLFFGMEGNLLGYFAPADLFTDAEVQQVGLSYLKCNTGDAIININAALLQNPDKKTLLYSTVAHELQHLINFSAYFETVNNAQMHTWLNEAMSGYIETDIYANAKAEAGHDSSFNNSALIRNGQSLYNFGTSASDVGVYGSVYYFAKYLEALDGRQVFSSIMDYWRDSYSSTLATPEALAKGVSAATRAKIENSIDFSAMNLQFDSQDESWMSKLCLDFYLSMLSNAYELFEYILIDNQMLLYDSLDGIQIEGGGRIIVALNGDTFDIPTDADSGLIYVGLDGMFKPVTNFIYK